MSSGSVYDIADALQIPLYIVEGVIRGSKEIEANVGPWKLKLPVTFVGDAITASAASGFVRISHDLWLYILARSSAEAVEAWVINGPVAKLTVATARSFCTGSPTNTLAKIKPAITQKLSFDPKTDKWKESA